MTLLRVLSPQVIVGFKGDEIRVFAADTSQTATFTDPEVLTVLAGFRSPALPEEIAASAEDPTAAGWLIVRLEEIGALIEPGERDSAPEPWPGDLVKEFLSPLAYSMDALAGAMAGMGPEVAEEIRDDTGIGLRQRLAGALGGISAVQEEVMRRAPEWVDRQIAALELPETGLSINLGAGSSKLEGWVNVDIWPAELSMDFRWGLPFSEASATRVYLAHVLEHLYYPREAIALLEEIHRVLASGGRIRIVVPDIEASIDAYVRNDRRFFEGRKEGWPHWKIRTRLESFLGFAGVGGYPGLFGLEHKWGYDLETVTHALEEAGFRNVERSSFQGSRDPEMRVDDASSWAKLNVDGRYYSLFVEAER